MSNRDLSEAVVVLGREVVDEALANPERAGAWFQEYAGQVAQAAEGIIKRHKDPAAARAFAAELPHVVQVALAGAWAGDLGRKAIEAQGIKEVSDDA